MLSLRNVLNEKNKDSEQDIQFKVEDLEKTGEYLDMINSPDREIDQAVKIAVLMDLNLIKEEEK